MKIQYAILFVRDMSVAVSFFRDKLGVPLKFESPHWSEFNTEGATLALHTTEAPPFDRDAGDTAAGVVRIGLNVENLNEYHKRLIDAGVRCLKPPEEVFGARVAQYEGPDRMVFSVGQSRNP